MILDPGFWIQDPGSTGWMLLQSKNYTAAPDGVQGVATWRPLQNCDAVRSMGHDGPRKSENPSTWPEGTNRGYLQPKSWMHLHILLNEMYGNCAQWTTASLAQPKQSTLAHEIHFLN